MAASVPLGAVAAFRADVAVALALALVLTPLVIARPVVGLSAVLALAFLEKYVLALRLAAVLRKRYVR